MDNRIYTITFVDLSYSWGPAVHVMELWNEYASISRKQVIGYGVLERNSKPYTDPLFDLRTLRLRGRKKPIYRRIRKVLFDLCLAIMFLFHRRTIVYFRQTALGLFLAFSLHMRRHQAIIEMNGLAKEDNINSLHKANRFVLIYSSFIEWLYMKIPNVKVVTVADQISQTVRERYKINDVYTMKNGCSPRLLQAVNIGTKGDSDILNIGFLGTFTPWDGHEKTVSLYDAIKATGQRVHFHIAGPEAEDTIIYEKFNKHDDFTFYGIVPYNALGEFYAKLDAAYGFNRIDRSKNVEQSALKLIEYWACKLPILSTAAKGNEFIEKYKIGYLVKEDEMNDKEKFKKAVKRFIELLPEYRKNYKYAPVPRTWRDVAEDTRKVLNV